MQDGMTGTLPHHSAGRLLGSTQTQQCDHPKNSNYPARSHRLPASIQRSCNEFLLSPQFFAAFDSSVTEIAAGTHACLPFYSSFSLELVMALPSTTAIGSDNTMDANALTSIGPARLARTLVSPCDTGLELARRHRLSKRYT